MDLTKSLLKRDCETTDNCIQCALCERQKVQLYPITDISLSESLANCPSDVVTLIFYYTIERITIEYYKLFNEKLKIIKECFTSDMDIYYYNTSSDSIVTVNGICEKHFKKLRKVRKIVIMIERFINLFKNYHGIYLLKNLSLFVISNKDISFEWVVGRQDIERTYKTIKEVDSEYDEYDVDEDEFYDNEPDDFS